LIINKKTAFFINNQAIITRITASLF